MSNKQIRTMPVHTDGSEVRNMPSRQVSPQPVPGPKAPPKTGKNK